MNFNQGDPNNPLMQLLAGRNPWGSAGQFQPFDIQPGGQSQHASMIGAGGFDPRYWEQVVSSGSEGGGGETYWQPRASTQQALGGRVQTFRQNVGGPGGVIDPSQVTYDDEFGLLTNPSNINAPEDNMNLFKLIALTGMGMAAQSAFAGGAGGAGGASGAASGGAVPGLNIPGQMAPLTQGAMGTMVPAVQVGGGGGLLGSLMGGDIAGALGGAGEWVMSNPLQALGAAQTIGGLLGGGSSGGGSGGGSGGSGGGGGVMGNFGAPKRPDYTPNPYLMAQLQRGGYL